MTTSPASPFVNPLSIARLRWYGICATWPEAINVKVQDGEVTLRGQADTLSDAEVLPMQVRHVLGVVAVDSLTPAPAATRDGAGATRRSPQSDRGPARCRCRRPRAT